MKDQSKTKQVLIQELDTQRMRIAELEQLELERKRASEVLRESEEYFKAIIQNSSDIIFILDKLGTITYASPSIERFLGYEPEEVIGKRTLDLIVSEDKPKAIADFGRALLTKEVPIPNVFRIRHKNGTERILEGIGKNLLDNPIVAGFVMNVRDITERKQAEERIHASLREKEILLREVHHREKNNLQVISGLLELQASSIGNPDLTGMLNQSQSRIQAMALVHEKLYASKDFARIDCAGYVGALSQDLFQSHKINPGKIDLIIQTDGVYVDINKAIPCGLVLNELISNALKHAFPGDRHGELQIIIREEKNTEMEIVVRDNGLGLPDDVNIHQPRTMGLNLVNGLVKKQLKGQMEVRRDNGTEIRIKFPL